MRVVITHDLGYGRLYHRYEQGRLGVIVVRIAQQSVPGVNQALERLFVDPVSSTIPLASSLVIIDDRRFRVISEPSGGRLS